MERLSLELKIISQKDLNTKINFCIGRIFSIFDNREKNFFAQVC